MSSATPRAVHAATLDVYPHARFSSYTRSFSPRHPPAPVPSYPYFIPIRRRRIRVFSFRFNPYKGPLSLITIATTRRILYIYIYILSPFGVWTRQGNYIYNIAGSKKLAPRIRPARTLYTVGTPRKRAALAQT